MREYALDAVESLIFVGYLKKLGESIAEDAVKDSTNVAIKNMNDFLRLKVPQQFED